MKLHPKHGDELYLIVYNMYFWRWLHSFNEAGAVLFALCGSMLPIIGAHAGFNVSDRNLGTMIVCFSTAVSLLFVLSIITEAWRLLRRKLFTHRV